MVKLTPKDKEQIRLLHFEDKVSYRNLARKYGVSTQTIYRTCNQKVYDKALEQNRQYKQKDKYQKEKAARRFFRLSFSRKNNPDIIEWLEKQDSIQSYIQGLIEDDMAKVKEIEETSFNAKEAENLE